MLALQVWCILQAWTSKQEKTRSICANFSELRSLCYLHLHFYDLLDLAIFSDNKTQLLSLHPTPNAVPQVISVEFV